MSALFQISAAAMAAAALFHAAAVMSQAVAVAAPVLLGLLVADRMRAPSR